MADIRFDGKVAIVTGASPQAIAMGITANTVLQAAAPAIGGRGGGKDEFAQGGGTNPEQLFAIGYAACFEGALGVAGRRHKVDVDDAVMSALTASVPPAARVVAQEVARA